MKSEGMKARISAAGTKYLAMSLPPADENLRLIMPSKHLLFGSNTPDPEFPVVATSPIRVENFLRHSEEMTCGATMWDRAARSASTTMTSSPGHGGAWHNGTGGSKMRV